MWVFRIMRTQTGIGACIITEEKERRRATVKMQLYVCKPCFIERKHGDFQCAFMAFFSSLCAFVSVSPNSFVYACVVPGTMLVVCVLTMLGSSWAETAIRLTKVMYSSSLQSFPLLLSSLPVSSSSSHCPLPLLLLISLISNTSLLSLTDRSDNNATCPVVKGLHRCLIYRFESIFLPFHLSLWFFLTSKSFTLQPLICKYILNRQLSSLRLHFLFHVCFIIVLNYLQDKTASHSSSILKIIAWVTCFKVPFKVFRWTTGTHENSTPSLYISVCIGMNILCQSLWGQFLKVIYSPLKHCCKNPQIIRVWFYYSQRSANKSSLHHLRVEVLSSTMPSLHLSLQPEETALQG